MKKIYYLLTISLIVLCFSSCDEEADLSDVSVLSVEESHQDDLDKWIMDNYTTPYNIEVKWRWDDNEVSSEFWVTPPQKKQAQEFLEAMLEIWIKPYKEETKGNPFLETFIPKIIVLVGTPQYNKDGTITLGLAEGGRKVTVFDIDNFDITDRSSVIKAFHTMHHEFAHVLHQTTFYSLDFKSITKGDYTGNWKDVSVSDANLKGYITPYSMLNENEDFVELVAAILTTVDNSNTPQEYTVPQKDSDGLIIKAVNPWTRKEYIKTETKTMTAWEYRLYMLGITYKSTADLKYSQVAGSPEGLDKINRKLQIVTNYFKTVWGVDLFSLQKRIDTATEALIVKNN